VLGLLSISPLLAKAVGKIVGWQLKPASDSTLIIMNKIIPVFAKIFTGCVAVILHQQRNKEESYCAGMSSIRSIQFPHIALMGCYAVRFSSSLDNFSLRVYEKMVTSGCYEENYRITC
jgi:hypothetical protein